MMLFAYSKCRGGKIISGRSVLKDRSRLSMTKL